MINDIVSKSFIRDERNSRSQLRNSLQSQSKVNSQGNRYFNGDTMKSSIDKNDITAAFDGTNLPSAN
jgi:hypothetical protein